MIASNTCFASSGGGADEVVSRTAQPMAGRKAQVFTRRGQAYDIVFDTIGKTSMAQVEGSLRPKGRYLVTVFGIRELLRMLWTSLAGGKRTLGGASHSPWTPDDLAYLRDLIIQLTRAAPAMCRGR
ncbi:zinc-binding dehydrogenase [Sorangium sp. So ce1182]|uniref:zinc-binding dehydrogenase n=1 Tax=Sorangium sp. So ce1182 TaxID=3133334 RepID=UPI003F5FE0B3